MTEKIIPQLIVMPIARTQEIEVVPVDAYKFDRIKIKLDEAKEQWIIGQQNDSGSWVETARIQCWSKKNMVD